MKRFLSLLLATVILLSGCSKPNLGETVEQNSELLFYYTVKELSQPGVELAVQAESRDAQVYTLDEMLSLYFRGPESDTLISPFPAGTKVLDITEADGELILVMSGEYFTLSGVELSLAACCLVNTVCQYANADRITVIDEMERVRLSLESDNYLLTDELKEETDTTFTLYFADEARRYLLPEIRNVTLGENISEEKYLIGQLIQGPKEGDRLPVIPEGTTLLWSETKGGVCTVNFSREFIDNQKNGVYGAYMSLMGVVNTLTALEGIDSVQFMIDGDIMENYMVFPLDQPISRNLDAVGPVSAASGEVDVDIFVRNSDTGEAFYVPKRVKQSISEPLAQAVVQMVLNYEPMRGFENPVPYGTEFLSVSVSGNVCYVDVTDGFIPEEQSREAQNAAVYALVSALTKISNVSSVVLTIEGESDKLKFVDLSEPLTAESFKWS